MHCPSDIYRVIYKVEQEENVVKDVEDEINDKGKQVVEKVIKKSRR